MKTGSSRAELCSPAGVGWVKGRVAEAEGLSRCRLAREVCEQFDWRDGRGRLKEMACRKELARLERSGSLVLPAARPVSWRAGEVAGPAVVSFCGTLGDLGGIEL